MTARSSFSTDLQVFMELDEITGTTDAAAYSRKAILKFLRLKGWKIDEIAGIPDVKESESHIPESDAAAAMSVLAP